ncbi:polycomb group ring finger protein 3 [Plakobranchus ocellatus]|uniref:Polycomb group ring finger protein 3 n=1 Tax=Plakobranchus ocellatus TaxID=259542 RepID=A0AAV3YBU5_9GAST|nr:polycomb group ring finger protein 3 [Plakobranchus ocellatus]
MESTEVITHAASSMSLEDALCGHSDKDGVLRIPVRDVNPHLICGLCQGYLYEACTITECMHSFCKSCLVKHLQRSLNCPMCAILIHPTDPFVHIRLDGLLQDIVYALLPQVEKNESEKEALFYEKHGDYKRQRSKDSHRSTTLKANLDKQPSSTPEFSYTPLTYTPPVALNLKCTEPSIKSHELVKPFVHVTGGATVEKLAKFLRKKLQVKDSQKVDLFCPCSSGLVSLNDSHTLKAVKDLYYHDAINKAIIQSQQLSAIISLQDEG